MKSKYVLRVSSGTLRGRGIASPEGMSVRPTATRVKEALFNRYRMRMNGADFLDLFAGTGQMGLEALSNGANAVFADQNTALARKNIEAVGARATVLQADFRETVHRLQARGLSFDFIFADPPYRDGLYGEIIALCLPLLKADGVLILEHATEVPIPEAEETRTFGSRSLSFIGGSL